MQEYQRCAAVCIVSWKCRNYGWLSLPAPDVTFGFQKAADSLESTTRQCNRLSDGQKKGFECLAGHEQQFACAMVLVMQLLRAIVSYLCRSVACASLLLEHARSPVSNRKPHHGSQKEHSQHGTTSRDCLKMYVLCVKFLQLRLFGNGSVATLLPCG
jgi:hypothetical protein